MRLPQYNFIQLAFDEITPISRSSHEFGMLTQVNLGFLLLFFSLSIFLSIYLL
jgi:hypothetical protein